MVIILRLMEIEISQMVIKMQKEIVFWILQWLSKCKKKLSILENNNLNLLQNLFIKHENERNTLKYML